MIRQIIERKNKQLEDNYARDVTNGGLSNFDLLTPSTKDKRWQQPFSLPPYQAKSTAFANFFFDTSDKIVFTPRHLSRKLQQNYQPAKWGLDGQWIWTGNQTSLLNEALEELKDLSYVLLHQWHYKRVTLVNLSPKDGCIFTDILPSSTDEGWEARWSQCPKETGNLLFLWLWTKDQFVREQVSFYGEKGEERKVQLAIDEPTNFMVFRRFWGPKHCAIVAFQGEFKQESEANEYRWWMENQYGFEHKDGKWSQFREFFVIRKGEPICVSEWDWDVEITDDSRGDPMDRLCDKDCERRCSKCLHHGKNKKPDHNEDSD